MITLQQAKNKTQIKMYVYSFITLIVKLILIAPKLMFITLTISIKSMTYTYKSITNLIKTIAGIFQNNYHQHRYLQYHR